MSSVQDSPLLLHPPPLLPTLPSLPPLPPAYLSCPLSFGCWQEDLLLQYLESVKTRAGRITSDEASYLLTHRYKMTKGQQADFNLAELRRVLKEKLDHSISTLRELIELRTAGLGSNRCPSCALSRAHVPLSGGTSTRLLPLPPLVAL